MAEQAAVPGRALPPDLVARARAAAAGEWQPPAPRDAATVVLLRDAATGPEAYLLRRVAGMAFAAGMYVFPGGSVDPRDTALPDEAWVGVPAAAWAQRLATPDEALARALVCAAVRETFEESGVLLAGPDAETVVADTRGGDWEADRAALLDRSLAFAALLERRRLVLRADLLRPWAHWITPELEPKRFDTRFFVAALPPGQRTRFIDETAGGEADTVTWARPADALARHHRGELAMLPPTASTLEELAAYPSVAAVLAAGETREVRPVLPRIVVDDDDRVTLLLPGEDGYAG